MAEATVGLVTVVREVTEKRVTLSLTEREAGTLAAILCKIAGSETNSPRGYSQRIHEALKRAGFQYDLQPEYDLIDRREYGSGFTFNPYPERLSHLRPSVNQETTR